MSSKKMVCYAPFASLNFEQTGNVVFCCYNRSYVVGRYPESSISDIWFGERAKKLRENIYREDLSLGCQLCEKQYKTGNMKGLMANQFNEWGAHTDTSHMPEAFDDMPKLFIMELTNSCNLECVMCSGYYSSSIRTQREGLALSKMVYTDQFIEDLKPFLPSLLKINFLGGEPFVSDIYYRIIEAVININPSIVINITTNCTVYNNRVKNLLDKTNINIAVSIDSFIKATYESIRKNASYEAMISNFHHFNNYSITKDRPMGVAVCPMKQNAYEFLEIVDFCDDNKCNLFFNTLYFPSSCSIRNWPPEQTQALLKYYKDKIEIREKRPSHNFEILPDFLYQIEKWQSEYSSFFTLDEAACDKIKTLIRQGHEDDGPYTEIAELLLMQHLLHKAAIGPGYQKDCDTIFARLRSLLKESGKEHFIEIYFGAAEEIFAFAIANGFSPEVSRQGQWEKIKAISDHLMYHPSGSSILIQYFLINDIFYILNVMDDELYGTILEFINKETPAVLL